MEQIVIYDKITREIYAIIPTIFYGDEENAVLKDNIEFKVISENVKFNNINGILYYLGDD